MIDDIDKRVLQLRAASTFEEYAHETRMSVWNQRFELFNGSVPADPLDLVDPAIALRSQGFDVQSDPSFGHVWDSGAHARVAGIVDQRNRIVRVAVGLDEMERRFTTAHELGHVVLHPDMTGLHRDRAVSGPSFRKDWRERDADAFASCFIMPARLLLRRFHDLFRMGVFRLNEDTVFGLQLGTIDQAQRRMRKQRDIALALATANSFMGTSFKPLSRFFRVSPTTMAIRLEEVGLVDQNSLRRDW